MKHLEKPKPLRVAKRFLYSFNTDSFTAWLLSWCKGKQKYLSLSSFFCKYKCVQNYLTVPH